MIRSLAAVVAGLVVVGLSLSGILHFQFPLSSFKLLYSYTTVEDWNPDPDFLADYYDMAQFSLANSHVVGQVHEKNPEFKALLYRNMRAVYPYWPDEYDLFKANGWILKGTDGEYIYCTRYAYDEYQLVDFGNASYQDYVANWIAEKIRQYGYDGVFEDNSLYLDLSVFWGASATPMNPRTGQRWTDLEVSEALIALHEKVKNAIGHKLLTCNGIWRGNTFDAQKLRIKDFVTNSKMDGWMSEGWMNPGDGQWINETEWNYALELLIWSQDTGKLFIPTACVENNLPESCTKEQMSLFGIATAMLGITQHRLYLHTTHLPEQHEAFYDLANILGKPAGNYSYHMGVYTRNFENGRVFVNPTGDACIVDEIVLGPHSGKIVTK